MHRSGARTQVRGFSLGRDAQMSAVAVPVQIPLDHVWELRLEEFEDGHSFRRFECVDCGAVRYE
jgi:hypothetical protein